MRRAPHPVNASRANCNRHCRFSLVWLIAACMEALLLRLATQLPPPARNLATEARLRLLAQFTKFGTVGTCGFVVDTAVVYALRGSLGLYRAGLASYFVAASFTWGANRLWTFRGIGSGPAHRQWARFLGANTLGFSLNRGTYMLLVTFVAALRPPAGACHRRRARSPGCSSTSTCPACWCSADRRRSFSTGIRTALTVW